MCHSHSITNTTAPPPSTPPPASSRFVGLMSVSSLFLGAVISYFIVSRRYKKVIKNQVKNVDGGGGSGGAQAQKKVVVIMNR